MSWTVSKSESVGITKYQLKINAFFQLLVTDNREAVDEKVRLRRVSAQIYFVDNDGRYPLPLMEASFNFSTVPEAQLWAIHRLREILSVSDRELSIPEMVAVKDYHDLEKSHRS